MFILLLLLSDEEYSMVQRLFDENNRLLYNISFQIVRKKELAEEVVQDTFLKIMDEKFSKKLFNMPCPERLPYCVVIVKNKSINVYNKEKKVSFMDSDEINAISDSQDIENDFVHRDDIRILSELIKELPIEEQQLFRLRWGDQLSFKEIANILDISEDNAKKRAQRLVKKIKTQYLRG